MSLFYFDNDIRIAEEKLDFSSAILRTESLLKHSEDSKYVATLIINAWFYFVEGDVNRNPINYQWQFFKEKWQQYIDTGLTLYDKISRFVESGYPQTESRKNKKERAYREYLFDVDPNYVLDRTYAENLLGDGTIWEPIGKLRKH